MIALGGLTLGLAAGPSISRYLHERQYGVLAPEERIPAAFVEDADGRAQLIGPLVQSANASHLVVLSSTCSSCLGELAAWNDLSKTNSRVRLVVVVHSDDVRYLQYVTSLISPVYPLYRASTVTLEKLQARRTPLVYALTNEGRISESALGVESIGALRQRIEGQVSMSIDKTR
jgi:hypothetical protein